MKIIGQFLRIAVVCFVSELLYYVMKTYLGLPVPASVYGLVIMFLLLVTGVYKLDEVEKTADWMVSMMGLFIVSSSVSLMTVIDDIWTRLPIIVLITVLTTIIVMVAAGWCAQIIIRWQKKKKEGAKNE